MISAPLSGGASHVRSIFFWPFSVASTRACPARPPAWSRSWGPTTRRGLASCAPVSGSTSSSRAKDCRDCTFWAKWPGWSRDSSSCCRRRILAVRIFRWSRRYPLVHSKRGRSASVRSPSRSTPACPARPSAWSQSTTSDHALGPAELCARIW